MKFTLMIVSVMINVKITYRWHMKIRLYAVVKNRVEHCVLKQDCAHFHRDDRMAEFFVETVITNIFWTAAFSCQRFIERAWIELVCNICRNGLKFSMEELLDALLF